MYSDRVRFLCCPNTMWGCVDTHASPYQPARTHTSKLDSLLRLCQCVVSAGSLMVVNHRGRIVYATNALGAMLGIPAKQLTSLDLQAIVPPPYAQLHTGFLKVGLGSTKQGCHSLPLYRKHSRMSPKRTLHLQSWHQARSVSHNGLTTKQARLSRATLSSQNLSVTPPATSCRGGAVVYLLRANGTRVPVTLRMSAHDDGEHVQHVVRVVPSSEAERLDRQRLVLGVGETGIVLSVNPGATKGIFGFNPQVGRGSIAACWHMCLCLLCRAGSGHRCFERVSKSNHSMAPATRLSL